MLLRITGHLDQPMGTFILDAVNRFAAANKRINIFCDWAETTGYASDVRSAFTQWVASNRSKVTFHLLVGSKIVAMGVSVANLALGGILVVYTNRASFDAAFRACKMGLQVK